MYKISFGWQVNSVEGYARGYAEDGEDLNLGERELRRQTISILEASEKYSRELAER